MLRGYPVANECDSRRKNQSLAAAEHNCNQQQMDTVRSYRQECHSRGDEQKPHRDGPQVAYAVTESPTQRSGQQMGAFLDAEEEPDHDQVESSDIQCVQREKCPDTVGAQVDQHLQGPGKPQGFVGYGTEERRLCLIPQRGQFRPMILAQIGWIARRFQHQHRQKSKATGKSNDGEHRRWIEPGQQPGGSGGCDQIAAAACHAEPPQSFGSPTHCHLSNIGQTDRSEYSGGQAVYDPNHQELLWGFDQPVNKRDRAEQGQPDQQPESSPPSVRQQPKQRFKNQPGHGRDRDDGADQQLTRSD